jgi:predicted  nucleic acid-binding Zn-ribbon protein
LADLGKQLAHCAEIKERKKSCASFSPKEFKKQERHLERIQPVADRLTAEVSDFSKQIETKVCVECMRARGDMDARKLELQGAEEELKSVRMERDSAQSSVREIRNRIEKPQSRRESLEKALKDANDNKPKMEEELFKKDELILNISTKQIELNQTLFELEPKIIAQTDNFTFWNLSLNSIDTDIDIVNKSFWKNLEKRNHLISGQPNTPGDGFHTASFILNETFYNLSFAEESLDNSTRRISQLVDLFRQSESFYLQKESELKEYTSKVEKGLIQKVDFKFEY